MPRRPPSNAAHRLAALITLVFLFLAAPAAAFAADADNTGKPNIVFLLTDDMGYGDIACYGAPDVNTPNIDRLANQGVRFTRFYANGTECTPTRTALMTGRWPRRAGGMECAIGTGNVGRYDEAIRLAEQDQLGLPPKQTVIPRPLKQAGYATAVFGKWHLGYEPHFNPLNYGFDEFFGFLGGNVDYFTHRELSDIPVLYENRNPTTREGYMTRLITDESVSFIRDHADQPFFLYVPYSAPHFPFQGPNDADKEFNADNWLEGTRDDYASMLESMDRQVGRILKTLKDENITDNTVVVFASDHGAMGPGRNAPFSRGKGTLFEGEFRVSCIVRWPGEIAPGTVSHQPGMTFDLTRSFLEIAGVGPPDNAAPLDGMDIIGHAAAGKEPVERTLYWRARRGDRTWRAVLDGDLKYITKKEGGTFKRWLFNVAADPAELHNLLETNPDQAARLKQKLADWESRTRPVR